MPRPKTDLTANSKNVGIRLTPSQYAKWKEIGGPKWLRQQLAKLIEQQRVAE
jgi:hypothetical protein